MLSPHRGYFNEAEARAPRMPLDLGGNWGRTGSHFNEAEARAPRMLIDSNTYTYLFSALQ